jgi:hypothetical protein
MARIWDFLAIHEWACYCLTGELRKDGQGACFFGQLFVIVISFQLASYRSRDARAVLDLTRSS